MKLAFLKLLLIMPFLNHCASSAVQGNEDGSDPVNKMEETEYKKAIHKCYKTGGSRVVKIEGKLRCF